MDTLRIISISLLAGCSVAGLVWYIWGIATNIGTLKSQRNPDIPDADDDAEQEPDDTEKNATD